jgi:hypothetical protein
VTGKEFSGVDLDRLADYVGGALDGTPAAAEIERLVTDDPRWREAYAALGTAMEQVRTGLGALGGTPEPMPADVAERLDAALQSAATASPATEPAPTGKAVHPASRPPTRRSTTAGRAAGVPPSRPARDGAGPPARGRRTAARRWSRWAGLAAAAAAAVALAGVGANLLGGGIGGGGEDAGTVSGAAGVPQPDDQRAAGPSVDAGALRDRAQASGSDYRPETLGGGARRLVASDQAFRSSTAAEGDTAKDAEPPAPAAAEGLANQAPAELRRLTDPVDLGACLTALTAGYRGPTSVRALDYARFGGEAALVVIFTDGGGDQWAAAVGPDCGLPSVGADGRFATRVP